MTRMTGTPRQSVRKPAVLTAIGAVLVVASVVLTLGQFTSPGEASTPGISLQEALIDAPMGSPISIDPVNPHQVVPVVTPMLTAIPPTPNPIPDIPQTHEQAATRSLLNDDESGVFGFVVLDTSGSVIASYNSFTPFVTASTYKLILMADIYGRIEAGELSLDQQIYLDPGTFAYLDGDNYFDYGYAGTTLPLETLLFVVGVYSSNAAALTLMGLTTPQDLNETAKSIGMLRTCILCDPYAQDFWPPEPGIDSSWADMNRAVDFIAKEAEIGPVNITTPYDMAIYQMGLVNDTVVSPWVSEQIVGVLQHQAIRDRLPVYNWDVFMVNKPGNLVGVVNDVGVLYLPNGPRAVAALSIDVWDDIHATEVLQLLGLIANGNAGW